jgi:hypothetical protein
MATRICAGQWGASGPALWLPSWNPVSKKCCNCCSLDAPEKPLGEALCQRTCPVVPFILLNAAELIFPSLCL